MPPKAKFTKDEIIDAALLIIKEEGIENLTARNLGSKLKSSSCPIFTIFKNMEEVKIATIQKAKQIYRKYVEEGLNDSIPFRGVGKLYIRFASEEPKLFQLLFMNDENSTIDSNSILPLIDENYEIILRSITSSFPVDETFANHLYYHMWIYTHGIACLNATRTCKFSNNQTENMLNQVFLSLMDSRRKKYE